MRVMICLDESNSSVQAVDVLLQNNMIGNDSVRLVYVSNQDMDLTQARNLIENAKADLASKCPLAKIDSKIEHGLVAEALLKMSSRWAADLILVGTNDRSGLDRLLLGSVSQYVVERAKCPVMIARANTSSSGKNNVLVALDDSEYSAASVEWLAEQTWARTKNIFLLSATKKLSSSPAYELSVEKASDILLKHQYEQTRISGMLEKLCCFLEEQLGNKQITYTLIEGKLEDAILQEAHRWPCELIVIGSHGRTGLSKMLIGSVSQSIAVKASCPVIVVRERPSKLYDQICNELEFSDSLKKIMAEKSHPTLNRGTNTGGDLDFLPPI